MSTKDQNFKLNKLSSQKLKHNITDTYKYIAYLKELDYTIIRTMGVLYTKLKIGINESRQLVLDSPSWTNEKGNFIGFNNYIWEIMEQETDEVKENKDGTISLKFHITKDQDE